MHNEDEDSTQLGLYGKNDHVYMQSLSAAVVQRSPRYLMMVVVLMFVSLFWRQILVQVKS